MPVRLPRLLRPYLMNIRARGYPSVEESSERVFAIRKMFLKATTIPRNRPAACSRIAVRRRRQPSRPEVGLEIESGAGEGRRAEVEAGEAMSL